MNKKQIIKINENQLKQIVMESTQRVLKEYQYKHNREYNRLKGRNDNDSKRVAGTMGKIPREIEDGLKHLSWVLPNNYDMRLVGSPQRLSKNVTDAIKLILDNEDTIIDAVMNSYSQYYHSYFQSDLDKEITDGYGIEKRYNDYYGHDIGKEPEYEPEKKPWDWGGE